MGCVLQDSMQLWIGFCCGCGMKKVCILTVLAFDVSVEADGAGIFDYVLLQHY
jgi:hypothetical protein